MTVWHVEFRKVYEFCVEAKNRAEADRMATDIIIGCDDAETYNETIIRPAKPDERVGLTLYEMGIEPCGEE